MQYVSTNSAVDSTEAVVTVSYRSRSYGRDQIIQDFSAQIFSIHKQLGPKELDPVTQRHTNLPSWCYQLKS